jgi:hypothetical protein
MSRKTLESQDASWRERQIDNILKRFVRILQGCDISRDELAKSVAKALASSKRVEPIVALDASPEQHLACTEVVFSWRHDGRLADESGNPRPLPISGDDPSFKTLCGEVAPQYQSSTLLDYLDALGAVRRLGNNRVELATESVLACGATEVKTVAPQTVLMHLEGFLSSVEFNLTRRPSQGSARFERACYAKIPGSLIPVFERLVESRGQNFIDSVDEWLERHKSSQGSNERRCLVGSGAYVFVHASTKLEES